MPDIKNPKKFEREGYKIYSNLAPILSQAKLSSQIINFKEYFLDCINQETPSEKRSLVKLIRMHFDNAKENIQDEDIEEYMRLRNESEKWLKSVGYRYGTRTAQEHNLSLGIVEEKYMKEPYKPTGLISGHIILEEARKSRELEKFFGSIAIRKFYNVDDKNKRILFNLEDLDEGGNTLMDPRLIDEDFNFIEGYKKSENFPFRRS